MVGTGSVVGIMVASVVVVGAALDGPGGISSCVWGFPSSPAFGGVVSVGVGVGVVVVVTMVAVGGGTSVTGSTAVVGVAVALPGVSSVGDDGGGADSAGGVVLGAPGVAMALTAGARRPGGVGRACG